MLQIDHNFQEVRKKFKSTFVILKLYLAHILVFISPRQVVNGCGQTDYYRKQCFGLTGVGSGILLQAESQSSIVDTTLRVGNGRGRAEQTGKF